MSLERNEWLASLTCDQFLNLDPWEFVAHDESKKQWIAEIRAAVTIAIPDDEILQIVYPGCYQTVKSAIRNYGLGEPAGRGKCVFGYVLAYLRNGGRSLVRAEIPNSRVFDYEDLDTLEFAPLAHGFDAGYESRVTNYNDSLSALPQFLSDGIVLSDEGLQKRHRHIETLRRFLTPREYQVLRLSVLEQQKPIDMCAYLGLGDKQVWKVRRALKRKLAEIAIDQGVCPQLVSTMLGKEVAVAAE